eukprot:TRINITY_DN43788_c0_g1_i1.p1 TRINITY_DN43788_c0_g1~~TRINITY_DN43788_c0_g1_i1.p1  ORF type:complete len:514 (-),score=46.17 TRINITY_DN43788_c0_g1_i1:197-1639(-)
MDASEYVDSTLEKVGGSGPFQYKYLMALGFCWAYSAHLCYISLFAGMPVKIRHKDCKDGRCPASPVDCSLQRHQWEYEDPMQSYLATFDLVCDRETLATLLPTFFFMGSTFGVVFWGGFADKSGRRKAMFGSLAFQQLGLLGQAASPYYAPYAAARFITGFGNAGTGLAMYLWTAEVVGTELRSVMAWFPNVFFALGQISLSLLARAVPQWRQLTQTEFAIGSVFVVIFAYLHESPKWLVAQGRLEEAHAVLCACAHANSRPSPLPVPDASFSKGEPELRTDSPGACQLLDRRLRRRFLVMCFTWFAISLEFYGLSLSSSSGPLDVHSGNMVNGLSCIPGYLVSGVLMEWAPVGRRGAVGGGLIVAGACLLVSCLGRREMLIVPYYIATSAASLAFAVIYVFSSELFPTDIRGTAVGLQSLCGRLGAMIAPFVAELGSKGHPTLALEAFAFPCIAAGVLLIPLPETRGSPLLGTIDDLGK